MTTLVGLSELYWVGLAGLLATIARTPAPVRSIGPEEESNVP